MEWLWKEIIPRGMVSLIAGAPGQGKSLLGIYLAAEVSRAGGVVILSNQEDPLRQVSRPRLEAAGADLDLVHLWTPRLPPASFELKYRIKAMEAALVLIDPIASHLEVSIYNDQDVRRALTPLGEWAEETGCSIVPIAHTIKGISPNAHPLKAVGGSSGGLAGSARVAYLFGRNPSDDDERILAPAKYNVGADPKSLAFEIDTVEIEGVGDVARLVLVGESAVTARGLIVSAATATGKPPEKRAAAEEWLTGYLRLGARLATEVKEDALQAGITPATLRRAKEELDVKVARQGFGKGSCIFWSLPPELVQLLDEQDEQDE